MAIPEEWPLLFGEEEVTLSNKLSRIFFQIFIRNTNAIVFNGNIKPLAGRTDSQGNTAAIHLRIYPVNQRVFDDRL